jgi:hypothetical protein
MSPLRVFSRISIKEIYSRLGILLFTLFFGVRFRENFIVFSSSFRGERRVIFFILLRISFLWGIKGYYTSFFFSRRIGVRLFLFY